MSKVATILSCLKGREKYIERYLHLAKTFSYDHTIIILREKNTGKINYPRGLDISFIETNQEIHGMSDIFKALKKCEEEILKYSYCHFVEDDNFVFTSSIYYLVNSLENSNNFSAAVGEGFLYDKKNFDLLNVYTLPSVQSSNAILRLKEFKGGLTYYSIFKTKAFTKICNVVSKISDHNMSELAFNLITVLNYKIKYINKLFLAREYPRPEVYNIPKSFNWITDENFSYELNNLVEVLKIELNHNKDSQEIFDLALGDYFSSRFKYKSTSLFIRSINSMKKNILKNNKQVQQYLENIKSFTV